MRFFPTSSVSAAPISYTRSSMSGGDAPEQPDRAPPAASRARRERRPRRRASPRRRPRPSRHANSPSTRLRSVGDVLGSRLRGGTILPADVERVRGAEPAAQRLHRRVEAVVQLRRRVEHRRVGQLEGHRDLRPESGSAWRGVGRAARARRARSCSSITSGGARRIRLPRVAKETPGVQPGADEGLRAAGAVSGQGASRRRASCDPHELRARRRVRARRARRRSPRGAPASRGATSSIAAPSRRERSISRFVLVRLDRGDACRAAERMPAVGEAGVEHLVLELRRDLAPRARRRRAGGARR